MKEKNKEKLKKFGRKLKKFKRNIKKGDRRDDYKEKYQAQELYNDMWLK